MPGSPTPEEREKADAELKAKEEAEQAALPYKWTQTIKDVDVTIAVDGKYKGRDLDVKLTKTHLKVAIKGQDPFIDVNSPRSSSFASADFDIITGRPPPSNPR